MKSLFSKSKIVGAIAFLAILLPSLAWAALNPVLDSVGLYKGANKSVSENWGTTVSASPNQTVNLMVHIHNNVFDTVAENVRVQTTLPAGAVTNYTSRATISASNAASVTGDVAINLSESSRIEYIPGSTVLYNHNNQLVGSLPDGITTTGIGVLPALNGCWEYENWVIYRVRIVEVPKTSPRVRIVKYNDLNGNGVQESNEANLAGWQFRVTGAGFNQVVTTNSLGIAEIENLIAGTYTVTELGQDGWVNTTPTTITRMVTIDPATQTFVFGNRRVVTPGCEEPSRANTPECQVIPPTALPQTGPAALAGLVLGSMGVTGGSLAYLNSRKNLRKALRK